MSQYKTSDKTDFSTCRDFLLSDSLRVDDCQLFNSLNYFVYQKSLTISRNFAVCKDAGALWELWRRVVPGTKLTGTCGELTGEVSERLRTCSHVCLDCKSDLRKEVMWVFKGEIDDSHNWVKFKAWTCFTVYLSSVVLDNFMGNHFLLRVIRNGQPVWVLAVIFKCATRKSKWCLRFRFVHVVYTCWMVSTALVVSLTFF